MASHDEAKYAEEGKCADGEPISKYAKGTRTVYEDGCLSLCS
jgi:hypothetical protein